MRLEHRVEKLEKVVNHCDDEMIILVSFVTPPGQERSSENKYLSIEEQIAMHRKVGKRRFIVFSEEDMLL